MAASRRRVVVTGIGMVTPLAANARATWKKIIGGSSGVRRLDSLKGLPTELAAPVPRISSDTGAAVDDDAFDPSKCRLIALGHCRHRSMVFSVSLAVRS